MRADWSYINKEQNTEKYSKDDLETITGRITKAAEHHGIECDD